MKIQKLQGNDFTSQLMQWHFSQNNRIMPWKGEPDPYKIWLSEIILQQTRVEQGLNYYLRFVEAYPTVFALAGARDEDVFKKWEGLGYYSRCRNLLSTARLVVEKYDGQFPGDYQALLQLKGVGPYTAAAIASFGFGLPYAVVDGNVTRVLSRFFLVEAPIDSPEGQKIFKTMAQDVLEPDNPGAFNQAIMDFGATVCKPVLPDCIHCPMTETCGAFTTNKTRVLPLKSKKLAKKERFFAYLIFVCKRKVWILERPEGDIWRHLNEFFLIELGSEKALKTFSPEDLLTQMEVVPASVKGYDDIFEQMLTHQRIHARFFIVQVSAKPRLPGTGKWIPLQQVREYAFPKTIRNFLDSYPLT